MFFKKIILFLFLPFCLFSSEFKDHLEKGGDLSYLETPEDSKRLGFFSALFDMAEKREKPAGEIPKIIHFIWLGPAPFPKSSIPNVKGWIDKHPDWKVQFWTDLGQSAPDDRMQVRSFDLFPLDELKEYYFRSDNFGERSQILRYAVLISVGGMYVDHDMVCIQSLESLVQANDFFCGMEMLGNTVLSSSVNPSPHLIAATAQHPIMKATKKWLLQHWDRLEAEFPGRDSSCVYNRVLHRTFRALSIGIKEACARSGRKDVIFPPNYFSLSDPKNALFASHQHVGSWYKKENGMLKKGHLLIEMKKELARNFWMAIILAIINLSLVGSLLLKRKKKC